MKLHALVLKIDIIQFFVTHIDSVCARVCVNTFTVTKKHVIKILHNIFPVNSEKQKTNNFHTF